MTFWAVAPVALMGLIAITMIAILLREYLPTPADHIPPSNVQEVLMDGVDDREARKFLVACQSASDAVEAVWASTFAGYIPISTRAEFESAGRWIVLVRYAPKSEGICVQ